MDKKVIKTFLTEIETEIGARRLAVEVQEMEITRLEGIYSNLVELTGEKADKPEKDKDDKVKRPYTPRVKRMYKIRFGTVVRSFVESLPSRKATRQEIMDYLENSYGIPEMKKSKKRIKAAILNLVALKVLDLTADKTDRNKDMFHVR